MKPKFHRNFLPVAAFLTLMPAAPLFAVDILWSNTGSGPWATAANWSTGTVPTAADRPIIKNGGEATVAATDTIAVQNLRFVNGTLTMTGGSIANSTDTIRIGDYAFDSTAGTATLTMSGAAKITGLTRVYLADGNGATSTVSNVTATLSDTASITATDQYLVIGRSGGTANVTLNGSSVIEKKGTTNSFNIGDGNLGVGTITLKDTSSLKASANVILGNSNGASGSVSLQGSSTFSTSGEIYVGNASGGTGSLAVSGSAIVTKTGTSGYITAARAASTGTITVEGSGQLISQNAIRIAETSGANGTIFARDNAVIQATGALQVGVSAGSTSKLDVSGSAQITAGGEFSVGTGGSNGTLTMAGGTVNANGTGTYVVGGSSGALATVTLSGTSVVNGGNMKWKSGDFGGNAAANAGTVNISLSDTASLTLREFTIGHLGYSTATENVTLSGSSTLKVNDFITIGRDDNNNKSGINNFLNLNGGTLATKYIIKGADDSNAAKNLVKADGGTIKALADESDFFKLGRNSDRVYVSLLAGGLKFNTNGFAVGIQNLLNGSGGLTKQGAGTLTLSGAQPYTGATQVNNGTLQIAAGGSLTGDCGVAAGGTLQVSPGSTFSGTCNVAGTVAVNGNVSGFWTLPALNLSNGSSVRVINLDPLAYSGPVISVTGGLAPSGAVTVSATGSLEIGSYPLIGYGGGSIGGDGFSAFQLGTLPRGVTAHLVDSGVSVDLDVTAVTPLVWTGNAGSAWDVNTTTNWTFGGSPDKYLEGDNVLFDDSATTAAVSLASSVSPAAVKFDNSSKDYTLGGSGAITGITTLYKSGSAALTLTGAHTYTGTTTVNGGTLAFGDGVTNGTITSALVNYSDVVFNPAGTATLTGTIGGSGFSMTKVGTGTQILTGGNTYAGDITVNGGTLQLGDGVVNGSMGVNSTLYVLASGTTLRLNYATADNTTALGWARITGAGMISLNSAQSVNGSAKWQNLGLSSGFTGTLRVEKGRVDCPSGSGPAALGGTTKVQIFSGAQILCFADANPYNVPIEIAGTGWGESGFPGALRLATGGSATWAGPVTLTADSSVMVQTGSSFTVTGSITGAYRCELQAYGTSPLTLAPSNPVRNSYGSTKISGDTDASVVAGNAYAFSSGTLEVAGATLKLNGSSFDFSSFSGTGGKIGNYHASAPATLTVGGSTDTSYTGGILDGSTAKLGLTKTGSGKLTLTGALSYTGDTTINGGTLSISTAALADASTVSIASGAKLDLPNAGSDTVGKLILGGTEVPAGTYDASHVTYGAYFSGVGSLVVVGGYSSWAATMGLDGSAGKENGLKDDPDHDGVSNLMEFYLNGNPLSSDSSILPVETLDVTYLTLTFSRRDDAESDVASQTVQYGSDLTGWTSVPVGAASSGPDANGVIVTVTENAANPDAVSVQIPRSLAPSGRLFGRLQVTK